jgi:hypothetical protein
MGQQTSLHEPGYVDHDRTRVRAHQPRPALVDDGGERAVNDNIYETLLARDADGELSRASPPSCPRRSTTPRGSSSSARASRSTTARRSTPTPSSRRSIASCSSSPTARPTTTASSARSPAPRRSTTSPSRSRPPPRRRAPARMYWLKIIPPGSAEDVRRPVRCPERHRPVQVRRAGHRQQHRRSRPTPTTGTARRRSAR